LFIIKQLILQKDLLYRIEIQGQEHGASSDAIAKDVF